MELKVVDLFSGAGGFSLGFKINKYKILLAIDKDHSAARTYSLNFPDTLVLEEDIRNIHGEDILQVTGQDKVDILIGSPPCEGFTAANPNRLRNPVDRLYFDERGSLTLEYIRLLGELKPKIFVMENVPAIVETKDLRDAILTEFSKVGYDNIYFNFLRAEDFGNPSKRLRVFISNIELSPKKYGKKVVVNDVISDLEDKIGKLPNHEVQELNEKKLKEISKLRFGDYLTMYKSSRGEIPIYIRLNPFDIAPTVLGNSRFIHPYYNRFLTVREQARLMSYPDNHVFIGSRDEQYNQVGEAVPVALSASIASYIMGIYSWI
ncbi:DNA (cytosine-5-)-methyltransferase [Acidianus sulfidivorans JP7]|uniref:DNA (cytosine-5-)-methyltransferase n=1 Tax=Acidianus sulfidivorans JP7 TaxID=619593 RepID=A0A2U9IMK7_9CREN|nr:DNA cytosine methyltransferase [Acidianus sulfidivorans]AWR97253.1 DNA (cytosine-5-)-methyltransferase [Acidianus sulfidivorans JP7]